MAELTISGGTHSILKDDYASEWMGIEVLALDDGHATIRMTLRQEMLNGFGMAHGGMIFAFGDTAFALACNPASPSPADSTTPARRTRSRAKSARPASITGTAAHHQPSFGAVTEGSRAS